MQLYREIDDEIRRYMRVGVEMNANLVSGHVQQHVGGSNTVSQAAIQRSIAAMVGRGELEQRAMGRRLVRKR